MITSTAKVALATFTALAAVSSAQVIHSNTYTGGFDGQFALKGCFSNSQPLEFHGSYIYQSPGNCQGVCYGLGFPVMGLVNGKDCWCGKLLPAAMFEVDMGHCDTPCAGYDKTSCGGAGTWKVWTTGLSLNDIPNLKADALTGSVTEGGMSTSVGTASNGDVVTQTVVAPESESDSDSDSSDGSSTTNIGGVVAGVVVGVTVLMAIVGGVYFFLRRRKLRQAEEAIRQHEIVAGFVEGGKKPGTSSSSMNDSRLDPERVRRQSDGSIADNQDYSRRILQVTNPDGYY